MSFKFLFEIGNHENYIPIVKENDGIFTDYLFLFFNNNGRSGTFLPSLKLVDITTVFKRGSRNAKDNYRPASILSNISTMFEKH